MQQILHIYRRMFGLNQEIEQAVQERRLDDLESLDEHLGVLQEKALAYSDTIRSAVRRGDHDEASRELLSLIQGIVTLNQKTVPQLQAIMAMHREELRKLHAGNCMLKGYRSLAPGSGGRLSSTG
ncbi:MAG: hypothetical protein ACOX5Z_13035 [Desulfobulbus sp.]|jgi:hypothetical protein